MAEKRTDTSAHSLVLSVYLSLFLSLIHLFFHYFIRTFIAFCFSRPGHFVFADHDSYAIPQCLETYAAVADAT